MGECFENTFPPVRADIAHISCCVNTLVFLPRVCVLRIYVLIKLKDLFYDRVCSKISATKRKLLAPFLIVHSILILNKEIRKVPNILNVSNI